MIQSKILNALTSFDTEDILEIVLEALGDKALIDMYLYLRNDGYIEDYDIEDDDVTIEMQNHYKIAVL